MEQWQIKDDQIWLRLEGNLNIERAEELKDLFEQGFELGKNLVLDIDNLESVDITFIQLCLALKKQSIGLFLARPFDENIVELAQDIGYKEFVSKFKVLS